jgi:hypothetical protein
MKKLDLHGIKHEDVRAEVIKFVEDGFKSNDTREIVFGHSPKMWKLVEEVLYEYDAMLSYSLGGALGIGQTFVSIWWK